MTHPICNIFYFSDLFVISPLTYTGKCLVLIHRASRKCFGWPHFHCRPSCKNKQGKSKVLSYVYVKVKTTSFLEGNPNRWIIPTNLWERKFWHPFERNYARILWLDFPDHTFMYYIHPFQLTYPDWNLCFPRPSSRQGTATTRSTKLSYAFRPMVLNYSRAEDISVDVIMCRTQWPG